MNDQDGKTCMRNSSLMSGFMLVHAQIVKNKVYFGLSKPISFLTEHKEVNIVCQCCFHCIEVYEHTF